MRPESTNGTGGGGLAVPMAWLCAEYVADELLRAGALVEPGSLEYRAGRRTLALTVYLGDGTGDTPGGAEDRLEEWLTRTAHGHPWKEWVRERLDGAPEPGGEDPDADLTLARETWRLLESTHLLATDLGALSAGGPADGVMVDESDRTWLPSWQVGLPLGHLALRLY
ncbi:hypothetical protein QWM81_17810 [Streptomyces ficellus]|uniref:Uncharacterized protein n=1 Tax=Streptomyces ficellus TaxID=1977088 RepID=A0ABT7Z9B7_9ACTN|nr:hypothetical protein [Streptomyces ficellus]MDN3295872.1 hypothetical protein [Streptomyces ficellus]